MNTSTHPIEQEELMAYLDGELPADRAAATAAHLERCAECQRLAGDLRTISREMKSWEVESPDMELLPATKIKTDQAAPQRWREWFRVRAVAPWAAGFAVCLLVVVSVRRIGTNTNTTFLQPEQARSEGANDKKLRDKDQSAYSFSLRSAAPKDSPGLVAGLPVTEGIVTRLSVRPDAKVGDGPPKSGPMVVRTATVSMTVQEFDKARSSLEDILKRHRGYVGDLQATSPSESGRALTATLRVPADQLDGTLTEIKKLGRVDAESQNGQEVTAQFVDLEARLANSRNTEQRLTDVLKQRTGKLSDVLEVETEIARVRGEIEEMEAERKKLSSQITFATLTATLTEDYKPKLQAVPPSTLTRFRNSAVDGYRSVMESIVGLVVFALSYGPSLLLWGGLLFFPARKMWRKLAASTSR